MNEPQTKPKLNSERVREILRDCLFKEDEDKTNHVRVEGVVSTFGFHPERVKSHSDEIGELLAELGDQFQVNSGGGWSFLNACMDKHGNHWGEHPDIEMLLALGIATEQARILMPREMWAMFPGGLPYFSVGKTELAKLTAETKNEGAN